MSPTDIRISLNVSFDYRKVSSVLAGTNLAARLTRLPGLRPISGLEIAVSNGKATMRGEVATSHERTLIERLARLEPGVWAVDNRLVVAGSPPQPAAPAKLPRLDSPPEPEPAIPEPSLREPSLP